MTSHSNDNSLYRRWLIQTLERHIYKKWESEDDDVDDLSERWEELDESLRIRIWGLSQDLETLHDNDIAIESDWEPIETDELKQLILHAKTTANWDLFLELIRRPPRSMTQAQIDWERYLAWEKLGEPRIAETFRLNAIRLDASIVDSDSTRELEGPIFQKGDNVLLRHTNEIGIVQQDPDREAGEYWYKIRFGRRTETVSEEDLDPISEEEESIQTLAAAGKWGELDAVRCALAIERIEHTNRSTVYAFQSQRILFQPYQYKPLLKVLDSPDRRLLIADEVGLGKTIEAGLILTELHARYPLDSVMIVCPSRLREKWKNELNGKFDQDFTIFDRRSFEEAAMDFVERPGRTRIRGIMSMQAMRYPNVREILTGVLGNLNLVIFDEAHHARNSGTSTNSLLHDLCDVSDAVILLTATPVQLDNSNLFNLLNPLRPTEFRDIWAFEQSLRSHADLHIASGLARTQDSENLTRICEILDRTLIRSRRVEAIDPLASQLVNELNHDPPKDRSDWIRVERKIQDLHPLGTILTRTKKRDVLENAATRVSFTYRCPWSIQEDEAYQRLISGSRSNAWPSSELSFGQVQRARQAASCLPAAYESRAIGKSDDEASELTDIMPSELGLRIENYDDELELSAWAGPDSKYEKFYEEILTTIWQEEPHAKILVFAFFKGTVRYLERKLSQAGVNVLRIDGDVPSDPRQPDKDERGKIIRQFKEDPKVNVLVSSEVGSEGLDFQFCHHLVNYDLPWNPMVVEQRIGRIDRFGQKSDKVFIHNLVVEGTVEDRILRRLYERIGIFERSIGALEAILGETIQTLQRDYLKAELNEDEADRRVEQAANAIEQRQQYLEDLEKNASQLFGHEEYVKEELQRVRNLGQFVTERAILAILKTYLRSRHPSVRVRRESEGIFAIKPTDDLRLDIRSAARKHNYVWYDRTQMGTLRFTTSGEIAFENNQLDLLNSSHPLVRAAVDGLSEQMSNPSARLGAAILMVNHADQEQLPEGTYFLALVPQNIRGIRSRRLIETIATNRDTGDSLPPQSSERLLFLITEHGEDWGRENVQCLDSQTWEQMERELRRRTSVLRQNENNENSALFIRRKNALVAEQEHELAVKMRRLATSMRNQKTKAVRLFESQLEKARSRHAEELAKLEGQQDSGVTTGEPIAVCLIQIQHKQSS